MFLRFQFHWRGRFYSGKIVAFYDDSFVMNKLRRFFEFFDIQIGVFINRQSPSRCRLKVACDDKNSNEL